MIGVYEIKNIETEKRYIGSSKDIKQRWRKHRHQLISGTHGNSYLQNSWNKYGEKSFLFNVIIDDLKVHDLMEMENYYIKLYTPEYNIKPFAENFSGYKHSNIAVNKKQQTQKIISHSEDGLKHPGRRGLCKKINLYTLDGDLISTFISQLELLNKFGGSKSYLSTTLSKRKLVYKRYIVLFHNDVLSLNDIKYAQRFKLKTVTIIENARTIGSFTIEQAAKLIGCCNAEIRMCASGRRSRIKNYKVYYE